MKNRKFLFTVAFFMSMSISGAGEIYAAENTYMSQSVSLESAGVWRQDDKGIYRYYTSDNVMWVNSVTPDGYYVDNTGAWIPDMYDVDQLQTIPSDAKSLVVIEGHGTTARASFYRKNTKTEDDQEQNREQMQEIGPGVDLSRKQDKRTDEKGETAAADGWQKITDSGAYIGRKGIGKEKSGDEKTPRGLFSLDEAFGTKAVPENMNVPYLQVNDGHYWVGDSYSSYYNTLVDIRKTGAVFDKSESEHLSTYGGKAYHYCMAVGYNKNQTPHKGSAIFLHCIGGGSTGGCIAIPEEAMITVLQNVEQPAYILIDDGEKLKNY